MKNKDIFYQYLPSGKTFSLYNNKTSNFNKVYNWISNILDTQESFIKNIKKDLFITSESKKNQYIKQWKKDYNIPNEIFYDSSDEENLKDIYCIKFLMKDNSKQGLINIAKLYDETIEIKETKTDSTVEINFITVRPTRKMFNYKFNLKFLNTFSRMKKLRKIFYLIKPVHIEIVELNNSFNYKFNLKFKS